MLSLKMVNLLKTFGVKMTLECETNKRYNRGLGNRLYARARTDLQSTHPSSHVCMWTFGASRHPFPPSPPGVTPDDTPPTYPTKKILDKTPKVRRQGFRYQPGFLGPAQPELLVPARLSQAAGVHDAPAAGHRGRPRGELLQNPQVRDSRTGQACPLRRSSACIPCAFVWFRGFLPGVIRPPPPPNVRHAHRQHLFHRVVYTFGVNPSLFSFTLSNFFEMLCG